MLKAKLNCISFLFFIVLISFSCTKESGTKNAEPYIASPEKLIAITGDNWNAVEPQVKNKKGYWYTEFNEEQNVGIKAAVSLQAVEESNTVIPYYMLLNVGRGTELVRATYINSVDSLYKLNKDEAYTLMLHYYNDGLKTLPSINLVIGGYDDSNGTQVNTTAEDIISKLNSGFETDLIYIGCNSTKGNFSVKVGKNAAGDNYIFSFAGFY